MKVKVPYVSAWENIGEVNGSAMVDLTTGEVNIIHGKEKREYGEFEGAYVVLNDEIVYVYQGENDFYEYWADLEDELMGV